jgi:hypothetical protein
MNRAALVGIVAAGALVIAVGAAFAGIEIGNRQTRAPAAAASSAPVQAAPSQAAATTPPPTPSPVSTSATVTTSCVTGIIDEQTGTFFPLPEFAGSSPDPIPVADEVEQGYQVEITDTSSSATAEVTGYAVVLYEAGTEIDSDQEQVNATFITPNQELTFTADPWGGYYQGNNPAVGPYSTGETGAIDPFATCTVVQTYTGQ